jgi:hypothetical protein
VSRFSRPSDLPARLTGIATSARAPLVRQSVTGAAGYNRHQPDSIWLAIRHFRPSSDRGQIREIPVLERMGYA